MERTFAIIKPNAFADGNSGKIIARIYQEGFTIVGLKKLYLSKVEAEGFYHVHRGKPFFGELTEFMASGPCITMVLEADNAIQRWRRPIQPRPDPAPCAANLANRSAKMPRTAPMARKRRPSRSAISSPAWNSCNCRPAFQAFFRVSKRA
jgi:nucleoside-diphosphate kinase